MEIKNLKLSICIATFNRAKYIGETLDSILSQLVPGVELVVVDGASSDNTPEVMSEYISNYPEIRYYREQENSGIDCDFDKAVGYASGKYCWLMADDDLIQPGSVERVLSAINDDVDLVVVDAEVRNSDLSETLEASRLKLDSDLVYEKGDHEKFFVDVANHLSFIGCVIIRRDFWLSRNRTLYYGTVFIHIGVIFQMPPPELVRVISEPLVIIRYGNAMWTPRAFDIWMSKWPKLIWSFSDYSEKAKQSICNLGAKRIIKAVFQYRAKGAYSIAEFKKYYSEEKNVWLKFILFIIAHFPARFANFLSVIYVLKNRSKILTIYDLSLCPNASWLSRYLSRKL
jgi:glycosyltransferase involved in cell wall biosynthesis